MSENATIARPYAKAIFERALHEKKLSEWSSYLALLAQVIVTPGVSQFIANPITTEVQHLELLQVVSQPSAEEAQAVTAFLALLAANKRLMLLPEITRQYEIYKTEQEKTLEVEVLSFSEIPAMQQEQLAASLAKRLQRRISLNIHLEPSLLGGAIIQAGDLVIDGSVRGKLNKLASGLGAV